MTNSHAASATAEASSATKAPSETSVHQRKKVDKSWDYVAKSLLAGGVAGCVAKTAIAPLDRVKILFQGHNTSFLNERGKIGGTFTTLRRIFELEGARGLFKGHSATLARIFPYAAINYGVYEQLKRILVTPDATYPNCNRLLAGSLAGASSVFITYPLDLVRARIAYQVKTHRYKNISQTIRLLIEEDGPLALYRGFVPTVAGILPYAGISFYTYDTLKMTLSKHATSLTISETGDLRVPYQLACGAVAGAAAQTCAYPLDVVRRRMQLSGMAHSIPNYTSMGHVFRHVIESEGWRGLFIGLSINYFKVVPATALSFATYEYLKKQLKIH